MDISLGGLRGVALSLRSWNSSGEAFNTRVREAARTAAAELASLIPNALVPEDAHAVLYPDQVSTDIAARVRTTSDRWVLEWTDTANRELNHPASVSSWRPVLTGEWNGIMHLEIQDSSGVWHRRQSRDWWITGQAATHDSWYVSLDRRWDAATATGMHFRVHQPEVFLRSDVHKLLAPSVIWDDSRQQQWPIETGSVHRMGLRDFRGESRGRPCILSRGRGVQLPTPHAPITLAPGTAGSWTGPWQEGTFTFCWTLCMGYRDAEWQEAPGGLRDPQWESAPSPISATFDHSLSANSGRAIVGTLPNIEAAVNFGDTTTLRCGHSGLFARIYVAQTAVRAGGLGLASNNYVETAGVYYPLMDYNFVGATAAVFSWSGDAIPDRLRQLRRSSRYFAWVPYPHQDARYELDLRVLASPSEYVNDQDTLPVHETYHPAFLHLFLYYLCLMDGVDLVSASHHMARCNSLLEALRDADESPAAVVIPEAWDSPPVRQLYGRYTEES